MGSLPITAEANTPGLFLGPHGIGTVDLCHTANCEVTLLRFGTVRPPRVHFALLCQVSEAEHIVTVKPFLIARLVMQSPKESRVRLVGPDQLTQRIMIKLQ